MADADDKTRELLSGWYERLAPSPLDVLHSEDDRSAWVDLDAWRGSDGSVHPLRGQSAVDTIFRNIEISSVGTNRRTTHLFAGFPGTGKTTELNRLARRLTESTGPPGYTVLRIRAKDYSGMTDALSVEEMAVLLAASVGEAALAELAVTALPRLQKGGLWENIRGRLGTMFADGVTFKLGGVDIKAALFRGGTSLRDQLRDAVGEQVHEKLRDFLHQLVQEIVAGIAPRALVVIVDDLEKFTVSTPKVALVYQQMADLFIQHHALLQLPGCHTIYTIPPYLALINSGIRGVFDGRVHQLPNVKIQTRPPERAPHSPGVEALTQVIEARVDLDALFGTARTACMQELILASGGHIRDLASLVRETVVIAMSQSLPLGIKEVRDVILENRRHRGNLFKDDLDILRAVSKSGDISNVPKDQLGAFASVMDQHLMLCYSNGDFWYDSHPLVAHKLERADQPHG